MESTEADTAYLEGIADVLGWDATEPAGSVDGWARPPRPTRPSSTGMAR